MSTPSRKIGLFILLIIFHGVVPAVESQDIKPLSITAGIEYQTISQSYYDAVIDSLNPDQLETTWLLSNDKIDDVFFHSNINYSYRLPNNLINCIADIEFSGKRLIGRAEGYYTLGNTANNLQLYGKFENKSPYEDDPLRDFGYNYVQSYLSTGHRLSGSADIKIKTGFESVAFTDQAQTQVTDSAIATSERIYQNYDYSVWSATLGGNLYLTELTNTMYWNLTYSHRNVPDSGEAAYDNYRVEAEYGSFWSGGYLSLAGEAGYKDYSRPGGLDDYLALNLSGRLTMEIGDEIENRVNLYFDNYAFATPDVVDRDYWLGRIELKPVRLFGEFEIGPLARLEYRNEVPFEGNSEEYIQQEVGVTAGYITARSIFADADLSYGKRNYSEGTGILTSYRFISASVMAAITIRGNLSLDLLFDGDFETHDEKQDNTDLYLLTIGLSAHF